MVAAMFHQLVNIDIASEDADTLPQNRKSRPSRCRSDSGEATQGLRNHCGPASPHGPILSSMEVASLLQKPHQCCPAHHCLCLGSCAHP